MKFMVVETFRLGRPDEVYKRFEQKGRMLPDGLEYLDSWLASDGSRCFQLMQTGQPKLFDAWTNHWNDLVEFEITELGAKPVEKGKGE